MGHHANVVGELQELVATAPLRERLRAQLMLALYRCGRQAEALRCYSEGRTILVERLGIEPHLELRALEQSILRQDPSLALTPNGRVVVRDDTDTVEAAVALGESWYTSLRQRDQAAFAALDDQVDTLERAMVLAIDRGDRESSLRIIGTTWFYWIMRGRHQVANGWCMEMLELPGDAGLEVETRGVIGASEIARDAGELTRSVALKEEALRLSAELGDQRAVEALLADLGHIWVGLGDLDRADGYARHALELRLKNPSNRGGVAHALIALGDVDEHRGDYDCAVKRYEEAIAVADDGGLVGEAAYVRARLLGRALRAMGDHDRAFGVFHRAFNDSRVLRDTSTVTAAIQGLGWVAAQRGDFPGAVRRYASVSGEKWQSVLHDDERAAYAADILWLRELVPSETFEPAWSVGQASPPFH